MGTSEKWYVFGTFYLSSLKYLESKRLKKVKEQRKDAVWKELLYVV